MRHDGHRSVSVLAQRLQLACLSDAAQLVLAASGPAAAPHAGLDDGPLSGPACALRGDDRCSEVSHELLVRTHVNDAIRARWRGRVDAYTGDLQGAVPRTYEGRRCGRQTRTEAARAAPVQVAAPPPPHADSGRTVRPPPLPLAQASPVPTLRDDDNHDFVIASLDAATLDSPCAQIQNDAWDDEQLCDDADGSGPRAAHPSVPPDSPASSELTDLLPARPRPRSRTGGLEAALSTTTGHCTNGAPRRPATGCEAAARARAIEPLCASPHSVVAASGAGPPSILASASSALRRPRGRGNRIGNFGVIACALVWDCLNMLTRERLLERAELSEAAWMVLRECRGVRTMNEWARHVSEYSSTLLVTIGGRAQAARRAQADATRYSVRWLWQHAVGRRLETGFSRDSLGLRVRSGGALGDPELQARLSNAIEARGQADYIAFRRAWHELPMCDVPRVPR